MRRAPLTRELIPIKGEQGFPNRLMKNLENEELFPPLT
jgi:hypothetical protein